MSIATSRRIINTISIIGLGLSIALTIYFINLGVFKDINALRGLVGNSVILGPIIFMLLQILQVGNSDHSWWDIQCGWRLDFWTISWICLQLCWH